MSHSRYFYPQIDEVVSHMPYGIFNRYLLPENQLEQLGFPILKNKKVYITSTEIPKKKTAQIPTKIEEVIPNVDVNPEELLTAEIVKKNCSRCGNLFEMTDGKYLTRMKCVYHWGKITNNQYSCCRRSVSSKGCTTGIRHVWSGLDEGLNGPLQGFVKTNLKHVGATDLYALDTEMVFTTAGLELCRVSLTNTKYMTVYDTLVKPTHPVVDLNTRYSGIYPKDMSLMNKTLLQVQRDLLQIISSETILVGHSLHCDLRALKIVHKKVIDTSLMFPHPFGPPNRLGLRTLASRILGIEIQEDYHDSVEDAKTTMGIVLKQIKDHLPKSCVSPLRYMVSPVFNFSGTFHGSPVVKARFLQAFYIFE